MTSGGVGVASRQWVPGSDRGSHQAATACRFLTCHFASNLSGGASVRPPPSDCQGHLGCGGAQTPQEHCAGKCFAQRSRGHLPRVENGNPAKPGR